MRRAVHNIQWFGCSGAVEPYIDRRLSDTGIAQIVSRMLEDLFLFILDKAQSSLLRLERTAVVAAGGAEQDPLA